MPSEGAAGPCTHVQTESGLAVVEGWTWGTEGWFLVGKMQMSSDGLVPDGGTYPLYANVTELYTSTG